MRTSEDFSGKDGELLLVEYCEEHPPLLNQVIKKRKEKKEDKHGKTECMAKQELFSGFLIPT